MNALCTPSICVFMMFGSRLSVKSSLVEIHGSIFTITAKYCGFSGVIVMMASVKEFGDEQSEFYEFFWAVNSCHIAQNLIQ